MPSRRLLPLAIAFALASSAAIANPTDDKFDALAARDWAFRLKEYPSLAREENPDFVSSSLGDDSEAAQARRHAFWLGVRKELSAISEAELSGSEKINYAIFRGQIDSFIADYETGRYLMPINSDSTFYTYLPQLPTSQPFAKREHYAAYLAKLADFPRYFANNQALLEAGIQRGMTVPQVVLAGRDAALRQHAEVKKPEDSVYYAPFVKLPDWLSAKEQDELRAKAKKVIADQVIPTYQRFLGFFTKTYVPAARQSLGAYQLPGGKAFYQAQIREYTTLDMAPEKIHALGMSEVKRIRGEMADIIREVGFKGSFEQFLTFLRTDPQFYAKTPRELLMHARDIAKRIDNKLPSMFKMLPRQPYGVEPVPADIAASYTAGRYSGSPAGGLEAGHYWVNTTKLESRPLYALPALTLHEAVPGHHLQNALAAEQGEQPAFRRTSYISAFGEGWALYSEHLGVEMGI